MAVRKISVLLLVCYIFALVNGDEESDIRKEEETNHNATVGKYLTAVITGALYKVFPKVNDQEKAEVEKILEDAYPLGDLDTSLPDTEEKLETNLCRNHRQRGEIVLAYVRKRFPINLITQVSVRLGINSIAEQNDWYCKDAVNRKIYITNASIINSHVKELSVAQAKSIDNSMVVVYGNSSLSNLAITCCSAWQFRAQSINAIPNPQTKHFIEEYINSVTGSTLKYLCAHYPEGSQECANIVNVIPPPPANYPRIRSLLSAGIETTSKLTSITL